jgi:hypothetical protein
MWSGSGESVLSKRMLVADPATTQMGVRLFCDMQSDLELIREDNDVSRYIYGRLRRKVLGTWRSLVPHRY